MGDSETTRWKNKLRHFWESKMFLQRNKTLFWLSMILISMIVIIMHGCSIPLILPEKYFGWLISNPNGDKTFYNIAISYVAAFIFYIIQVYIPARQIEKRAYHSIRGDLSDIVRSLKEVMYLMDNMYETDEDGIITVANSEWFYYYEFEDSNITDSDRIQKKEIRNNKVVRKMHRHCRGRSDLYNYCEKIKKSYINLKNRDEMQKLDINTENAIRELNVNSFCEGFFSTLNLSDHIDELKSEVNRHNVEEAAKNLNERKMPGIYFVSRGNKVIGCTGTGEERVVLESNIPFTAAGESRIIKMEKRIQEIEYFLDIDGKVYFRENTLDEEKRQRSGEKLTHIIQNMFR